MSDTLLPPGEYQGYVHFIRHGSIDFTDIATGERHSLRLFPNQRLKISIAMLTQHKRLDDPAGAQIMLDVGVVVKGDRAFNYLKGVRPPKTIIPFTTSVPTPAQLAALPVLSFEEM